MNKVCIKAFVLASMSLIGFQVNATDFEVPDVKDGVAVYGFSDNVIGSFVSGLCRLQNTTGVLVQQNYLKEEDGVNKLIVRQESNKSLSFFDLKCTSNSVKYCKNMSGGKCSSSETPHVFSIKNVFKITSGTCRREVTTSHSEYSNVNTGAFAVDTGINGVIDTYDNTYPRCSNKRLISDMKKAGVSIKSMTMGDVKNPTVAILLQMKNKSNPWKNPKLSVGGRALWEQFKAKKSTDELVDEINKSKIQK